MEVELGTSPYTHQKVFRSKGVERYMALINEHGAEYQVGYLSDCFAGARVLNSIRVVEWKPNQILSRILFYQSTTTFWHRILTQIPWEPQKPVSFGVSQGTNILHPTPPDPRSGTKPPQSQEVMSATNGKTFPLQKPSRLSYQPTAPRVNKQCLTTSYTTPNP